MFERARLYLFVLMWSTCTTMTYCNFHIRIMFVISNAAPLTLYLHYHMCTRIVCIMVVQHLLNTESSLE